MINLSSLKKDVAVEPGCDNRTLTSIYKRDRVRKFLGLLVFLVLLLPHGDLYAYALSLKDPSLFVCGDGSLWRLASEYPNGELLLTPEGKSVPNTVKRGTTAEE